MICATWEHLTFVNNSKKLCLLPWTLSALWLKRMLARRSSRCCTGSDDGKRLSNCFGSKQRRMGESAVSNPLWDVLRWQSLCSHAKGGLWSWMQNLRPTFHHLPLEGGYSRTLQGHGGVSKLCQGEECMSDLPLWLGIWPSSAGA